MTHAAYCSQTTLATARVNLTKSHLMLMINAISIAIKAIVLGGLTLIYGFICWIAYTGANSNGVTDFVRHVVLIPGLVPYVLSVSLLVLPGPRSIWIQIGVVLVTLCLHFVVFAISAHSDGLIYWVIQSIELLILPITYLGIRAGQRHRS